MRIWMTPFNRSNKQATGASIDSGFDSLDAVKTLMGEPQHGSTDAVLIYGDGEQRTCFTRVPLGPEVVW